MLIFHKDNLRPNFRSQPILCTTLTRCRSTNADVCIELADVLDPESPAPGVTDLAQYYLHET